MNRRGEVIASAVTNLDLHDLGRAARTYGLSRCYIVTPLSDQQALSRSLLGHWCDGIGRELHPDREQALRILSVVDSIEAAKSDIESLSGKAPKVWATTAREEDGAIGFGRARSILAEEPGPYLILLGTGWGLHSSVIEESDEVLTPIRGETGYNHLSVRCAAAIMMDRLLSSDR